MDQDQDQEPRNGRLRDPAVSHAVFNNVSSAPSKCGGAEYSACRQADFGGLDIFRSWAQAACLFLKTSTILLSPSSSLMSLVYPSSQTHNPTSVAIMSDMNPEKVLKALKTLLLERYEPVVAQLPEDALDNDERRRLRCLSDRFPPRPHNSLPSPALQESRLVKVSIPSAPLGLGIVANGQRQATGKIISDPPEDEEEDQDPAENHNPSQGSRKRTATDKPVSDEEEDEEEQDGEEQDGEEEDEEEEDREEGHAQERRKSKRIGQKSRRSARFGQGSRKNKRLRTEKTQSSSVQEAEEEQATTSPNTKSIALRGKSSETWATIRKMDTMPLHKSVAIHLESNLDREPALFLNDTGSLLLMHPKAPAVRSVQEGFASILLYHNQMEHRSILDRVRVLFIWLFFGDLAATLYGENCLITKLKAREIVNALETRLKSRMNQEEQHEIEDALIDQIPNLHTKGKRLAHLCSRFGTGSLFFLAEHLTSHFVQSRITLQGGPYNEAMLKLEALGLKEKAESSGANLLGDRTRKVLADEFGVVRSNGHS